MDNSSKSSDTLTYLYKVGAYLDTLIWAQDHAEELRTMKTEEKRRLIKSKASEIVGNYGLTLDDFKKKK